MVPLKVSVVFFDGSTMPPQAAAEQQTASASAARNLRCMAGMILPRGFWIADCGLRIADCGVPTRSCGPVYRDDPAGGVRPPSVDPPVSRETPKEWRAARRRARAFARAR